MVLPAIQDAFSQLVFQKNLADSGASSKKVDSLLGFHSWIYHIRVVSSKTSQVRYSISVLCNPGKLKVWVESAGKMHQIPQNVLLKNTLLKRTMFWVDFLQFSKSWVDFRDCIGTGLPPYFWSLPTPHWQNDRVLRCNLMEFLPFIFPLHKRHFGR